MYALPNVIRVGIDAILNAHAAIVVFFVLSGYVLTGALARRGLTVPAVTNFYISRMFRLLPAMWVVSGLSAVLLLAVPSVVSGPALSAWFVGYLHPFPSLRQIALSLVAIDMSFIMPIWTIFIEFVGSALMPILVAVAFWQPRLLPWLVVVLGSAACLLAHAPHRLNTFGFMFEFALGVLIATDRFRFSFHAPVATMLVASAVLLFFRAAWFACLHGKLMPLTVGYEDPVPMIIEALAAGILIAAISGGHRRPRLLSNPSSIWLGDVSYSLYLVHFPIGILMAKLISRIFPPILPPILAMSVLLSTSIVIVLVISHVLFRCVEMPMNKLGKDFSYKVSEWMQTWKRGKIAGLIAPSTAELAVRDRSMAPPKSRATRRSD
jgi:peptidoglycan/LPS O-acetylase OafA/YrhL